MSAQPNELADESIRRPRWSLNSSKEGRSIPAASAVVGFVLVTAFIVVGAGRAHSVETDPRSAFTEVFTFSLQGYWCENHLSVADVDGDGRQDIVLMTTALASPLGPPWSYVSRVLLLRAQSDGTYQDSVITNFPGQYGYGAVAADLNSDGAPDLILREQSATHVLLNDKHGAFREVWTGWPGYYNLAVVDVNHDGFPDFISGTQTGSGGLIELFTNDGTGTKFTRSWQSRLYGSGYDSIETVLSVNLNDDSSPDIAAREIYSGLLVTLFGSPAGDSFVERNVLSLGERTFALTGGRVNADRATDLAAFIGWGRVQVWLNQGDGSMSNYWQSPNLEDAAYNLALADFDQDGFDDLFVGTFGAGALRIYRNDPGVGFDPWWEESVPGEGYVGTVADLNDDGYPDLIVGEEGMIRVLLNRVAIPRVKSLSMSQGVPTVTWTACPGSHYRVQSTARLEGNDWTDLDGDVIAHGFTASKSDSELTPSTQRFYRVLELPAGEEPE